MASTGGGDTHLSKRWEITVLPFWQVRKNHKYFTHSMVTYSIRTIWNREFEFIYAHWLRPGWAKLYIMYHPGILQVIRRKPLKKNNSARMVDRGVRANLKSAIKRLALSPNTCLGERRDSNSNYNVKAKNHFLAHKRLAITFLRLSVECHYQCTLHGLILHS